MGKLHELSPINMLDSHRGRKYMGVKYLIYLNMSVVLAVTTGWYLWFVEQNNTCQHSNNSNDSG